MVKIGVWSPTLNKYIPYLLRRSPCLKCLVRACCTINCENKVKWNDRYDIFLIPLLAITVLICIIILIPFMLLFFILGVQLDAPEDPYF